MLKNLLVPIDGSEIFAETVQFIHELAEKENTCIHLLHILEDASDTVSEFHPVLKPYVQALQAEQWHVNAEIRTGDPVVVITRIASKLPDALLLMSTHGRSGLDNIREGSVTEQVVRQSACPVFILHSNRNDVSDPAREHTFRHMLVPLDGTEESTAILPCVQKFARKYDTQVTLLYDELRGQQGDSQSKRRDFLIDQELTLTKAGVAVKVDYTTTRHRSADILDRTANLDIDIVAMATHGVGGKRRHLDDSIAASVIRHVNRPLLVWSADPQCPI